MKKLYFFLFFAFSFIANAQIINFTDTNFKNYLINTNCVDNDFDGTLEDDVDTNDDGEIQISEAQNILSLQIGSQYMIDTTINDIAEISYFTNLKKIYLAIESVNSINLSNISSLENIFIGYSNSDVLGGINLSNLNLLTVLNLQSIRPVDYELPNSKTNIDLTNCANLESLNYSNSFVNINFCQISNLKNLDCNYLEGGEPDIFDFSCLTQLETLNVSENFIKVLILKNGSILNSLVMEPMNFPDPEYICIDEDSLELQQIIAQLGANYTSNINSYCSFNPGGTFYEILGNTKFDLNSNGCDAGDIDFSYLNFSITDGTTTGTMIANSSGNYYIPVQAGSHTITPNLENPTYFNISPTSFVVDFPTNTSPFTQNFCVTANGVHSDVEVRIIPTSPARPGFNTFYIILYSNKGNQIENGTVSLTFDDTVLDYLSSNPVYDNSATNTFTWNYTNLQPFETRQIIISFNVNAPTDTPPVNIDDILNYTATITTANTDETPDDNTFALNQTVVGSYDPNDKTCLEGETVDVATVGKYVHYVIRFENTGTYPAQNIVVKDIIDTSKFDVSTLVPLDGSHEFYTRIKDNKVEFIFENINLDFNDATNDGYVSFKIKTLPTLTVGQTFSNDANIYFDYNFPITTNEYVTTIQNVLSNQDFAFENEFVLYPNPAKEVLNISSKNQTEISSIEIYNIVGQVVIAIPNTTKTIDVSNLETGTYFIKVNSETGTTTTKFVKE